VVIISRFNELSSEFSCGIYVWWFRYIAICHPMRAKATNTVRRTRRIILCLWAAGVVYCCPWLALATTMPRHLKDGRNISICGPTNQRHYRHLYVAYYVADLVIFYAAPLLTATVLYTLIARKLYELVGCPSVTQGRDSIVSIAIPSFVQGIGDLRRQSSFSLQGDKAIRSRIRVCRLPVCVVAVSRSSLF